MFDRRVALVAAAALWLYPSLVFFNVTVLTETLFTLLLVTFLLAAIRLLREPTWWHAALCGLTLGVAALTRSVLWPMPLVLGPLLLVVLRGPVPRRIDARRRDVLGFLVPVTPWAIRNTKLQGVPTIVDTMGGINLRMGNYEYTPDTRMWDAVAITGTKSWVNGIDDDLLPRADRGRKGQVAATQGDRLHRGASRHDHVAGPSSSSADFWGIEREFLAGVAQV